MYNTYFESDEEDEENDMEIASESTPLSGGFEPDNTFDHYDKRSDNLTKRVAYMLTIILGLVGAEVIIPFIFYLIDLYIGGNDLLVLSYGSFAVLAFGLIMFIFLLHMSCVAMYKSFNISAHRNIRGMQQRGRGNGSRLPLVRYVADNVVWIVWSYLLLLVTQLLLFLSIIGLVPSYAFLIPLYIMLGSFLSGAIVCKSTHALQVLSLLCVLSSCIMYNLVMVNAVPFATHEEGSSSVGVTWNYVFLPVVIMNATWVFTLLYIITSYMTDYYTLQWSQLEALGFYMVAFVTLTLAVLSIADYLDARKSVSAIRWIHFASSDDNNLRIGVILLVVGLLALFVAMIVDVQAHLELQTHRMGGHRPKELRRGATGGYEVDPDTTWHYYVLLGEIEVNNTWKERHLGQQRSRSRPGSKSILNMCCVSTIEMCSYDSGEHPSSHYSNRGRRRRGSESDSRYHHGFQRGSRDSRGEHYYHPSSNREASKASRRSSSGNPTGDTNTDMRAQQSTGFGHRHHNDARGGDNDDDDHDDHDGDEDSDSDSSDLDFHIHMSQSAATANANANANTGGAATNSATGGAAGSGVSNSQAAVPPGSRTHGTFRPAARRSTGGRHWSDSDAGSYVSQSSHGSMSSSTASDLSIVQHMFRDEY